MEALGQLTGGIAHDFNNLLTIIVANVDRAQRLSAGDAHVAALLDNARTGAERAARLTDQLLAFARRQPLQPQRHDLNRIVRQSAELFGRTLDAGVRIETDFAEDLWTVSVDLGQTENAILNLIVNARDAMPDGGTVQLSTRNEATPEGDTVVLEVTDTGAGMDETTRQRAFEPFFTTKPMGRGTGLGLAQVYGFAQQSGGMAEIDSVAGSGTTVRLFLPRAESDIRPNA
jgi:signal transduction histidine kinase